jgi:hypothetical protein
MGSKLEYLFLLTKIDVMVLDVMIEDGVGGVVPMLGRLVVDVVAHVGGGTFFYLPSRTRQISKVQFPIVFGFSIFQFTKSPSPPNCPKFVQSPIFYRVNYYGGNWKLKKSPNCPKFSQFTKKSPNFQSRCQSPISKVQILSNLKDTVPDRPIITI